MNEELNWMYDEFNPVGAEFTDPEVVREYDEFHRQFRDFDAEARGILTTLKATSDNTLLDMGCGTGNFARAAAKLFRRVYVADVSEAMLSWNRAKAEEEGIHNMEFVHGGFLTYEHEGAPLDFIVSQMALHHLPDFWKQVGLRRCHRLLRPGGRILLDDVVFNFPIDNYAESLQKRIQDSIDAGKMGLAQGYARHFREEFSTTHWIMEGLLRESGFEIEEVSWPQEMSVRYVCRKPLG